jgi:hypothetical protein
MQLDTIRHKVHQIITDSYVDGDIDDNHVLTDYTDISEIELDYIVEEVCDFFEVYFELTEDDYLTMTCEDIAKKVFELQTES